MATSYTSLLGLALPVTGELQGTWGTTVNDEITSLLDTAVAGTTTLNTDADVTLTTTTGAANQARQAIILWTANGTVTRNITAPAQSKIYTVINKTAGTQSIVIRGAGPTTGVTVPAGRSMQVAWNGSDFVDVSDSFAATGTANGVLYLNGSKVVTSGTDLVFNATGLGIGTSSPTDKLHVVGSIRATSSNNVTLDGSDTAFAGAWQGVSNTANNITWATQLSASNNLDWWSYVTGASTRRMTLDSSGNLGLGVTPSGWASGFKAIESAGASGVTLASANVNPVYLGVNWFNDGNNKYKTTGTAALHEMSGGGYKWYLAPSGTAGNAISFTQAMTLTSGGDLQIGNTSYAYRVAASRASDGIVGYFRRDGATVNPALTISCNETGNTVGFGTDYAGATSPAMTFSTGGSERARITSGGNLLVGTQTDKSTALSGSGNGITIGGSVSPNLVLWDTDNAAYLSVFAQQGTDTVFGNLATGPLRFYTDSAERARITSGGDLLVGTTSAGARLCVNNSGANVTAFTSATWDWYCSVMHNQGTTNDNLFVQFGTEGTFTGRGSITYNRAGGLVAYNTTSDYRAKDIIGPVQNVGATIDALKVYEGVMKGATQSRPMLIAHEAQAHAPYAVSGVKDEVNEDGTPKFQQMDVSSLVPLLLAEIQSLRARVQALEAKP